MSNLEQLSGKMAFISREYITKAELAEILKISRATIDRWRKEGIPSHKIGKGVRFIEVDIHDWIAKNKSKY
jgi:excisionase family DNA binding protein